MKYIDPQIIDANTPEYDKLLAVAELLTASSPNNAIYVVQDVYFDLGQDWMWTTICRKKYRDCQVLYPNVWRNIIASETPSELQNAVKEIKSNRFFGDV